MLPNEMAIAYSVQQARRDQVQLRWLDRPAKRYVVEHFVGGLTTIKPEDNSTYTVEATKDGMIQLRQFLTEDGYVDVRHKKDGEIELRTRSGAENDGKFDPFMIKKVNPGVADDYCRVFEYVRDFPHRLVIFCPISSPYPRAIAATLEDWDRTSKGFGKIPQDLHDIEYADRFGADALRDLKVRREEERRKNREAYLKRKAKKLAAAAQTSSNASAGTSPPPC